MVFRIVIFARADVVRHAFVRCFGDDVVVVLAGLSDIGDRRELGDDVFWVCLVLLAGFVHEVDVLVLVADRDFRMLFHPFREEDDAVDFFLVRHEVECDIRACRLRPRDFVDAVRDLDDVRFLIRDPATGDHAAVDAVAARVIVLRIPLVLPTVVVCIDEVRAEKIVEFFEFHCGEPPKNDLFTYMSFNTCFSLPVMIY